MPSFNDYHYSTFCNLFRKIGHKLSDEIESKLAPRKNSMN